MRKIFLSFILLLALATPGLARDFAAMSVNVPDGWTVMDQGETLTLYSADMSSTASISVSNSNGASAAEYAAQAARGGGLGEPQPSGSGYLLPNNAAPSAWVYIAVFGNKVIVANLMGDSATLLGVVSSARPR